MCVLRLVNGNDLTVKLPVKDAISAIASGGADFVELPGEDGPIHIRASGVVAVLDDAASRRGAGFRTIADAGRD